MGWCHEFGPQIKEGCGHPMEAQEASCTCPECGVECTGRFDGCADVWRRRPEPVEVRFRPSPASRSSRVETSGASSSPVGRDGREPAASAGPGGMLPVQHVAPGPSGAEVVSATESVELAEWLRDMFDGLWSEVQSLRDLLGEHEDLLTRVVNDGGDQSVQQLAETLPQRIQEVVGEALERREAELAGGVQSAVAELRGSMHSVEEETNELIGALAEAFGDEYDDLADELRRGVRPSHDEAVEAPAD